MTRTQLSLLHPRLLRSLVLLDPVIQIPNGSIAPAILSTRRRDIWPSRIAAAEIFRKSKFYQSWDPRVLHLWIQNGLREVPTELFPAEQRAGGTKDERVTLMTSKHQELFTFPRPTYRGDPTETYADLDPALQQDYPGYPFYRAEPAQVFRRLPELRPSVLYIFGGKSELSPAKERKAKMAITGVGAGGSGGVTVGRVKQVVLDCGHLVAMERVKECADHTADFLGHELQRWRSDMEAFQRYWKQKPRIEEISIDERWARDVKPQGQTDRIVEDVGRYSKL